MSVFIRIEENQSDEFWEVNEIEAIQLGVGTSLGSPPSCFPASDGLDAWGVMRRSTPWFDGGANPFHSVELGQRSYYPRIARPLNYTDQRHMRSPSTVHDTDAIALGRGQAEALTRRLDLICQTVHPEPATLGTYGHEIRNLLILAATEVESHWRGVLLANGVTRSKDKFSTNDYVQLLRPMRLDSYAIGFTAFPWLTPLRPFHGWDTGTPTTSLPWYDAYNAAKHGRENAFHRANLAHAMEAVAASVVMLAAQFTQSGGLSGNGNLKTFYRFTEVPSWDPGELYVGRSTDVRPWTAVHHPRLV